MANERRLSWVNLMMKYFCVIIPDEEFNEAPCVVECEEEVLSPKVIYVTSATPCNEYLTENTAKRNIPEVTGGGINPLREAKRLNLYKNMNQNAEDSFGMRNSKVRKKDSAFYLILIVSFYLLGLSCLTIAIFSRTMITVLILIITGSLCAGLASVALYHIKKVKDKIETVYTISSSKHHFPKVTFPSSELRSAK